MKKERTSEIFLQLSRVLDTYVATENLRNVKHFHVVMNLSFHFPNRDHLRFVP